MSPSGIEKSLYAVRGGEALFFVNSVIFERSRCQLVVGLLSVLPVRFRDLLLAVL
jgi:hypothetical protein